MLRDYEDGLAIAPSELTLIKAANQFRELDAHMTPFCTRQLTSVRCVVAAPITTAGLRAGLKVCTEFTAEGAAGGHE